MNKYRRCRYTIFEYDVKYSFSSCEEMHKFIEYCHKYDIEYSGISYWARGKEWLVWFTVHDFFIVKKLERLFKVFNKRK